MKEMVGDLWEEYDKGAWIAIPTNGVVRKGSPPCAVMGAGVAKQAKNRFPEVEMYLGLKLKYYGNHVYYLTSGIYSFPTKHHFKDKANLKLIEQSAKEIAKIAEIVNMKQVVIPRPGCGCGEREWEEIKPILEPILDNRFYIISREGE